MPVMLSMSSYEGHAMYRFMARSLKHATIDHSFSEHNPHTLHDQASHELGCFGWLVIIAGIVFPVLLIASVKYTVGDVVASLTMIEDPESSNMATVSQAEEKSYAIVSEAQTLEHKPVTTSILASVRRLRSVAGLSGLWRGLCASIMYHVLHGITTHIVIVPFSFVLPDLVAISCGHLTASALLGHVHMTWTHCMVARSSQSFCWGRVRALFKPQYMVVFPSIVLAITQQVTLAFSFMVFQSYGPVGLAQYTVSMFVKEQPRLLATLATGLFLGVTIVLPASITLTRIEASLVPRDAELIVHFDRSFGSVPIRDAGVCTSYLVLYEAAWRSVKWISRIRIILFYVKYGILLTILMAFSTVTSYSALSYATSIG